MAPTRAGRETLVLGGTGLVGAHLVELLSADPAVTHVRAPGRRPMTRREGSAKVDAPVVDLARPQATPEAFRGDQVFVCLGSTLRKAGSREAFRRVDFDLLVGTARAALEAGAREAFLVSSVGADPTARSFYLRVKGEAEEALSTLPFRCLHVFRPSVLTGNRTEFRPSERLGVVLGGVLAPLMVGRARRYRPIAALTVARAMARVAATPTHGRHVYESEEIAALGR